MEEFDDWFQDKRRKPKKVKERHIWARPTEVIEKKKYNRDRQKEWLKEYEDNS